MLNENLEPDCDKTCEPWRCSLCDTFRHFLGSVDDGTFSAVFAEAISRVKRRAGGWN